MVKWMIFVSWLFWLLRSHDIYMMARWLCDWTFALGIYCLM